MHDIKMSLSDPDHKALVKTLMREYPRLDQLQAETLVWAFFSGLITNDNKVHSSEQRESCGRAGETSDPDAAERVQRRAESDHATDVVIAVHPEGVADCERDER